MRKIAISAALTAVLFVTACGGDDPETTTDSSTDSSPSESSGGGGEQKPDDSEENAGGEIADLTTALLTAEDLPEGAQLTPISGDLLTSTTTSMAGMLEDVTYEPADCGGEKANETNPLAGEGVQAEAVSASVGELPAFDVVVHAVYSGASSDGLSALEDYAEQCSEVALTGTIAGQTIDSTSTITVVDAPSVDADATLAIDVATTSAAMPTPIPLNRAVYIVDGDYGIMLSANPESEVFDLDALAQTALDKLHAAQG